MSLSVPPGLTRLRFDGGLQGFNNIIKLFFDAPNRVKASGKRVVAKWALSPVDPIYAGGALAYDSYTYETLLHMVFGEETGIPKYAIEAGLGPDLCPWNLAMAGAIISKRNAIPIDLYLTACGSWCDDVAKCWHFVSSETSKPYHFLEIPRFDEENSEWAIDYLTRELELLFNWLKKHTGQEVTDEALRKEIKRENKVRKVMLEITELLQADNVPIPALEYFITNAMMGDCLQDPDALHKECCILHKELKERMSRGLTAPGIAADVPLRIFYSGVGTQEFRVWNAIEDYGGVLVGCDTYLPLFRELIPENGSPIESLARWIWRMPFHHPTSKRIQATIPFIKKQRAEAVIISNVIGCRNLSNADKLTKDLIREELGIPVISIETSFPYENVEKVETQIKAFIEMTKLIK